MGSFIFGLGLAISAFYTWYHAWRVAFWLAVRYGISISPDLLGVIGFVTGLVGAGVTVSGTVSMAKGRD